MKGISDTITYSEKFPFARITIYIAEFWRNKGLLVRVGTEYLFGFSYLGYESIDITLCNSSRYLDSGKTFFDTRF